MVVKEKVLKEGIPKYFPKHTKDTETTCNGANQDTSLKGQDEPLKKQDMQPESQGMHAQLNSQNTKPPAFKNGLDSLADKASDLSISGADIAVPKQRPP